MNIKAEPASNDAMPREVATAMLTEPKAKLSNRMRKNCRAAREKVYLSTSPMVLDEKGFHYTGIEPKQDDVKLIRRAGRATWQQLNAWYRRSVARRMAVQTEYEKLCARAEHKDPRIQKRIELQKIALTLMAQQLDFAWGAFGDELKRRRELTEGKQPIDPVIKRRNALHRLCAAACL